MNWKKKLATCTLLIVISSFIIFIINKIVYFIATLDNLLNNTEGDYYEWRFGKIFYAKQGEGPPILLIHDLTSYSSGYEWNKVVKDLAKKNTVYTIDLIGCGRSDKPMITYTNFLYVQLITDFIKHVINSKVDIVVTGESCSFVIMASKNDDSIIDKITMVNPLDITRIAQIPTKKTKILKSLFYLPFIGTLLYNIVTTKSSVENLFFGDYFYDCSKVDELLIRTYHEASHTSNLNAKYLFSSIKSRYTNVNVIPCLKDLTNSIFIIAGDGTPNNITIAEQYSHFLPSIEIVGIDKTKQLPQLERPEEFIDQLSVLFEI